MSGNSARSLGYNSAKLMVELYSTLKLLTNKIKRKLPDYLKDNLYDISIVNDDEEQDIYVEFHFDNNDINKEIQDIRADFASCIQNDNLPIYRCDITNSYFILIFRIGDYI